MEYEGKKYSKELVNTFESACAGKKKDEEENENALNYEASEELANEAPIKNDDMEFFNSMQKLMAANTDADDKTMVHSQNKGLELGSKAFG